MGYVFNWAAALGVVAGIIGLILAGVVYWTRSGRAQNRRLALMLAIESLAVFGGAGMMYLTDVASEAWAWQATTPMFILMLPFAYLLFLATLDTPLVRPLRHPVVDKVLWAGLVLAPLLWFVRPDLFIQDVVPGTYSPWSVLTGPGFRAVWIVGQLPVSIFGLIAAISFWRRTTRGSSRRGQARAYTFAFGIRDLGWLASITLLTLPWPWLGSTADFIGGLALPALWMIAWVFLLAYGILKTQLFDIDLKIKLGIERSTLVGAFGVTFLAVSEVVEVVLGVEGTWFGIAAAVVIGLFFRRIELGAARIANRLMPGVEDTPAYRTERARQIYVAAVESAMMDDEITDRERDVLARLQDELGLTGRDALMLEREARSAGEI